jgi:hypothetical protein
MPSSFAWSIHENVRCKHRKSLLKTGFVPLSLSFLVVGTASAQSFDGLLKYDYRSLVAHSELLPSLKKLNQTF